MTLLCENIAKKNCHNAKLRLNEEIVGETIISVSTGANNVTKQWRKVLKIENLYGCLCAPH